MLAIVTPAAKTVTGTLISRLRVCRPEVINMLRTHCRNCLILPPAFPPTVPVRKRKKKQNQTTKKRVAKGCGLGGVAPWEHAGLGSVSPFMPHSFTLSPH